MVLGIAKTFENIVTLHLISNLFCEPGEAKSPPELRRFTSANNLKEDFISLSI